ncbi:hypothetical protein N7517_003991 [Penicillium concentricum]|uniref:Ketoreductase domain-containing protein n=1 Tax=Penicillium concentricum TaxID=293559 RepID=A0A9W9S607_9EURO|nr:uncharacterized protein N7517_003991 [Penicillium concentricum]KAJ5371985.1 hypothetical protein N7517_003991 [Penicillium concentricum]
MAAWNTFVPTIHHTTYASISETNPRLRCDGRVIFITGGGRGVGRAIAKSFAIAQAEGLFIIGRSEQDLQETLKEIAALNQVSEGKIKLAYHKADILDPEAVSAAYAAAIATFGRIDVLVQNAGYLDDHLSITKSNPDDYWRCFEVNVKGGLNVIRGFLETDPKAGATIINIGSGAGHIPYIPGYSAYSASKLSLAKIVEYVQHENPQLRVFNINPGAIATDMQAKAGDLAATDEIGLPGSFCVWLVSTEDADSFKGRFLWSNWDVDELVERADDIQSQNLLVHGLNGL